MKLTFVSGVATNGPKYVKVWFRVGDDERKTARSHTSMEFATRTHEVLQRVGSAAAKSNMGGERFKALLTQVAASESDAQLQNWLETAKALEAGSIRLQDSSRTIGQHADDWFDGRLTKQYPHKIAMLDCVEDYKRFFNADIRDLCLENSLVTIGDTALESLGKPHLDRVMQHCTQRGLGQSSIHKRWIVLRLLGKYARIAGRLPRNPFSTEDAPSSERVAKHQCLLFPHEETQLLGSTQVPLRFRMVYGFICREAMRWGEVMDLRWGSVDTTNGVIELAKSKTGARRPWAMQFGTRIAMMVYKARFAPEAGPDDHVFLDEGGSPFTESIIHKFRQHLKLAGITERRPALLVDDDHHQPIRVHDLRATFVSIAKATGRTDEYIKARTGHTSAQMVEEYNHLGNTWQEARLAQQCLVLMNFAIPELRPDTKDKAQAILKAFRSYIETVEQEPKRLYLHGDTAPAEAKPSSDFPDNHNPFDSLI